MQDKSAQESACDVVKDIMHSLDLDSTFQQIVDVGMGAGSDSAPVLLRTYALEAAVKLAAHSGWHNRALMAQVCDRLQVIATSGKNEPLACLRHACSPSS